MVTVYTKEELKEAINNRETEILLKGEIRETFKKQQKIKTGAKITGALAIIGGIAAAPFTFGSSLTVTAIGAAAISTAALTGTEIALVVLAACLGGAAIIGAINGADIVAELPDGTKISIKYKEK